MPGLPDTFRCADRCESELKLQLFEAVRILRVDHGNAPDKLRIPVRIAHSHLALPDKRRFMLCTQSFVLVVSSLVVAGIPHDMPSLQFRADDTAWDP